MKKIITFTPNPCVDETIWMKDGRETRRTYQTGGKGFNVARVLASLGNQVAALGPVQGPTGDHVVALTKEEGFEFIPQPCQGETRKVITTVQEDTFGQDRRFYPGPLLLPEHIEAIRQDVAGRLEECSLLLLAGRLPEGALELNKQAIVDLYPSLIGLAHEKGVPVWLDCHGIGFFEAATAGPDFFKPNLEEALELAEQIGQGCPGYVFPALSLPEAPWDEDVTQRLSPLLHQARNATLLISLGEEGLFVRQNEKGRFFPPYPVETINPVGSGDSFVAAWLHGWLRGYALEQCVALAQAAGAANASMWRAAQLTKDDLIAIDHRLKPLL